MIKKKMKTGFDRKVTPIAGYKASLIGKAGKKQRSLIVNGAVGITEYFNEKISIDTGDVILRIHGEGLECLTYTCGAVEIKGKIEKIELIDTHKGGKIQ